MLTYSHKSHTCESFPPFQPSTSSSILSSLCPERRPSLLPTSSGRGSRASITFFSPKGSESSPISPLSPRLSFGEKPSSPSHRPLSPRRLSTVNEARTPPKKQPNFSDQSSFTYSIKDAVSATTRFRMGPFTFIARSTGRPQHTGLPDFPPYPWPSECSRLPIRSPPYQQPLDRILNQTLIILSLSRVKTPAVRYTNRRTAPTVHKALHLLIRVQYLRSAKRSSRTRASIFADTSRNSFVSRPTSPKTQFTSTEAHGTSEKSRQCIDYRCKRKRIWFGAGASNWQTGKGAGYERDAEGRRRGLRIPNRQGPWSARWRGDS